MTETMSAEAETREIPEDHRIKLNEDGTYTAEEVQANRDAWVRALRSGAYAQGDGVLTAVADDGTERHCCLGVASYIAGLPRKLEDGVRTFVYADGRSTAAAPPRLRVALGLTGPFGELPGLETSLAALNDSGESFLEIATRIQRGDLGPLA